MKGTTARRRRARTRRVRSFMALPCDVVPHAGPQGFETPGPARSRSPREGSSRIACPPGPARPSASPDSRARAARSSQPSAKAGRPPDEAPRRRPPVRPAGSAPRVTRTPPRHGLRRARSRDRAPVEGPGPRPRPKAPPPRRAGRTRGRSGAAPGPQARPAAANAASSAARVAFGDAQVEVESAVGGEGDEAGQPPHGQATAQRAPPVKRPGPAPRGEEESEDGQTERERRRPPRAAPRIRSPRAPRDLAVSAFCARKGIGEGRSPGPPAGLRRPGRGRPARCRAGRKRLREWLPAPARPRAARGQGQQESRRHQRRGSQGARARRARSTRARKRETPARPQPRPRATARRRGRGPWQGGQERQHHARGGPVRVSTPGRGRGRRGPRRAQGEEAAGPRSRRSGSC